MLFKIRFRLIHLFFFVVAIGIGLGMIAAVHSNRDSQRKQLKEMGVESWRVSECDSTGLPFSIFVLRKQDPTLTDKFWSFFQLKDPIVSIAIRKPLAFRDWDRLASDSRLFQVRSLDLRGSNASRTELELFSNHPGIVRIIPSDGLEIEVVEAVANTKGWALRDFLGMNDAFNRLFDQLSLEIEAEQKSQNEQKDNGFKLREAAPVDIDRNFDPFKQ